VDDPTPAELVGSRLEGVPALRIGHALRGRRTAERISQADAAAAGGISVAELEEIETGARLASPSTIAGLLARLGCTVDQFLPRRCPLDPALLAGLPDRHVLQHYIGLVRKWRGVSSRKELRFRPDDLRVLVGILGTDADEIERRLVAITGCTGSTARRFRRLLLVSLAAPLSVLAAAIVPGLSGTSGGAPAAQATTERLVTRPAVKVAPVPTTTAAIPATTRRAPATTAAPVVPRPAAPPVTAVTAVTAVTIAAPRAAAQAAVVGDEEATVAIPSLNIDLPVVEGGQSVIDEGVVAHYVGAGWLAPIAAGAPGTYWLAAHHVTHGGPFDALPNIHIGDNVVVTTRSHTFVYTVTSTQVVGVYAGYGPVYGTDPSARTILLQTCLNETDRFLVHGILTSES